MTKTRILHVTYDMRIGGTEMVIKNIIDSSGTEQFDMSVLCIESPLGPFAEELEKNGTQFFKLNRKPGFDTSLIANIKHVITTHSIDIVHCHQYTPWVYGTLAALFTSCKVVFTEHGRFYPDSSSWKRKVINPALNFFTEKVTAISAATKDALVEFENISSRSIGVIYNGISPLKVDNDKVKQLRAELMIPKEHIILGTIARFDPIKNHPMMLRAFAKVLKLQPKTTLIIVGDGEERQNIEKCIEELHLKEHVLLIGYEPHPKYHLAIMDIYLLSSFSEGTSMTLLEAMSLAKPSVVTNAGGNPEVIQDSYNGFVTDNDNDDAFAEAILKLMDNKIRNEQAKCALSLFNERFSSQNMNQQYADLYNEVAPKQQSSRS